MTDHNDAEAIARTTDPDVGKTDMTAGETATFSDGGSLGPSPLAVVQPPSDPASGRSQPSPDVSVDELEAFIGSLEPDSMAVARALLARYKIGAK